MTLDIDLFRKEKGGNPDKIKENAKKRFDNPERVDQIVEADEKWRKGGQAINDLINLYVIS